jgi:hypothetical protein
MQRPNSFFRISGYIATGVDADYLSLSIHAAATALLLPGLASTSLFLDLSEFDSSSAARPHTYFYLDENMRERERERERERKKDRTLVKLKLLQQQQQTLNAAAVVVYKLLTPPPPHSRITLMSLQNLMPYTHSVHQESLMQYLGIGRQRQINVLLTRQKIVQFHFLSAPCDNVRRPPAGRENYA